MNMSAIKNWLFKLRFSFVTLVIFSISVQLLSQELFFIPVLLLTLASFMDYETERKK